MSDQQSRWLKLALVVSIVAAITFAAMWWDARSPSDSDDVRLVVPTTAATESFQICSGADRPSFINAEDLWRWNTVWRCFETLSP